MININLNLFYNDFNTKELQKEQNVRTIVTHTRKILEMGVPIPKVLQSRLAYDRNRPPDELVPPAIDTETSQNSLHWMDLLTGAIAQDIKIIEAERDEMMAKAAPPARLMDAVFFEDRQDPLISFDTLEAGAKLNQTYGYINKVINQEKQWSEQDNAALDETLREEILGMSSQEREWRLRQLLYEKSFKEVAARTLGILTSDDNAEAIRLADEQLDRFTKQNGVESQLHKRLYQKRQFALEKSKKTWSDEDYDRVRRHMLYHLSQYHPNTHKAILRGAIVSTYMNDQRGSDAAVWVPGTHSKDGRLPGIAETTIEALREIGLLNQLSDSPDGVITYPSTIVSELKVRSLGIQNAWFGWYQGYAAKNGLPVPDAPSKMDKATRKTAHREFKKAAQNLRGAFLTIQPEKNENKQIELIAYTSEGVRLGPISDQNQVLVGQKIEIKGSFARSGNLRIAIEDT